MLIKATHRLEIAANSPVFEIAHVLVCFDHVANIIINDAAMIFARLEFGLRFSD